MPFTDLTQNLYKSLMRLPVVLMQKLFGIGKHASGSETGEGTFHLNICSSVNEIGRKGEKRTAMRISE